MDIQVVETYLRSLQDEITSQLEKLDGKAHFQHERWTRAEGGGGESRVLKDGGLFEQAGRAWRALGVSLVLHPLNPYVPTAHMNVRCFAAPKQGEATVWWFGGGFDLTP